MDIIFKKKFTSIDLEEKINEFNQSFKESKKTLINFRLEKLEWIANEELCFLFAWIDNLYSLNYTIKIHLNISFDGSRASKRSISLWNNWNIYKFRENYPNRNIDLESIFNITHNIISKFQSYNKVEIADNFALQLIPFTTINTDYENNQNSNKDIIAIELAKVFHVQKNINELFDNKTEHNPFDNKILSDIISTELFLNVVHHTIDPNNSFRKRCYLSLVKQNKRDIEKNIQVIIEEEKLTKLDANKEVYNRLVSNVKKERCKEEQHFFLNIDESYNNESYIGYTFLDFAGGIPNSLRDTFRNDLAKTIEFSNKQNEDTQILEYAYQLHTSRNPFEDNIEIQDYIPRGLYFIIEMLKRYNGLLIVRSNKGKIIYDFSKSSELSKKNIFFSENDSKLPNIDGTIITMFFPTSKKTKEGAVILPINIVESSSIKTNILEYIHIKLFDIEQEAKVESNYKTDITSKFNNKIFKKVNDILIKNRNKDCIYFFDFNYCLSSLATYHEKLYYFLIHSPYINLKNRCIILNPQNGVNIDALTSIKNTNKELETERLNIHRPIPCVFSNKDIRWLGISNKSDIELLTKLLISNDIAYIKKDILTDESVVNGNFIAITEIEDVCINIPNIDILLNELYLENPKRKISKFIHEDIEIDNQGIKSKIYKTSSGYYQFEFISFFTKFIEIQNNSNRFSYELATDLLNKYYYYTYLESHNSNFLFDKKPPKFTKIVAVTMTSHILAEEIYDILITSLLYTKESLELIRLSDYNKFASEFSFNTITQNDVVLIINDVISTGALNKRLCNEIKNNKKAHVQAIFSIVDTRLNDDSNSSIKNEYTDIENRLVTLHNFEIEKYNEESKEKFCKEKNIDSSNIDKIHINSLLNAKSKSVIKSKQARGKVLYNNNNEYLNFIENEHLMFGHYKLYNSCHTYFIDTRSMLKTAKGIRLVSRLINEVKKKDIEYKNKIKRKNVVKAIDRLEKSEIDDIDINLLIEKLNIKYPNTEINVEEENERYNLLDAILDIDYIIHITDSGFDNISREEFMSMINKKSEPNKFRVIRLPRGIIDQEWAVPFFANYYDQTIHDKKILIIDEVSSTGESLLKLIDSVCYLNAKKIIVLSLLTRIKDYQGEFLTRVHKIINNNDDSINNSIPIDIYFGATFCIPSYLTASNECPHCSALEKYKSYLKPNLPDCIKTHIKKSIEILSLNELPLKDDALKVIDFIPNEIDKKLAFIYRDHIGHLIIQKKSNKYLKLDNEFLSLPYKDEDIEVFMAIILHEPNLIEIIKEDIKELYIAINIYIEAKSIFIDDFINIKNNNTQLLVFEKKDFIFTWREDSILFLLNVLDFKNYYTFTDKLFLLFEYANNATCKYSFNNDEQCKEDALNQIIYNLWHSFHYDTNSDRNKIILLLSDLLKDKRIKQKIRKKINELIVDIESTLNVDDTSNSFYKLLLYYLKSNTSLGHSYIHNYIIRYAYELNLDDENVRVDFESFKKILHDNWIVHFKNICADDFIFGQFTELISKFKNDNESVIVKYDILINKIEKLIINEGGSNIDDCYDSLIKFSEKYTSENSSLHKFLIKLVVYNPFIIIEELIINHKEDLDRKNIKIINDSVNTYPVFIHEKIYNSIIDDLIRNLIKHNKDNIDTLYKISMKQIGVEEVELIIEKDYGTSLSKEEIEQNIKNKSGHCTFGLFKNKMRLFKGDFNYFPSKNKFIQIFTFKSINNIL